MNRVMEASNTENEAMLSLSTSITVRRISPVGRYAVAISQ